MANEKDLAVLSLHVYRVPDGDQNAPRLPGNWTIIKPRTEGSVGFAYAVYKNTSSGEIVVSFRGTDGGIDWLTNTGLIFSQESQAAKVYTEVVRDFDSAAGGANITFTGHSLGGGLAGTMAVWFNRSAKVLTRHPARMRQPASWLSNR